jgi:uncharacterized membrane protein
MHPRASVLLVLLAILALACALPAAAQTPDAPAETAASDAVMATAAVGVQGASPTSSPVPSAGAGSATPSFEAGGPVVRGVFFFSPTCVHCEKVISEDLPGLFEESGGKPAVAIDESLDPGEVAFYLMGNGSLQLLMVDVSVDTGARMFVADSQRLGLDQAGVPRIDMADGHFVGEVEIPERLPGIIAAGLAGEGIDWPDVPGLSEALKPFPDAGTAPRPGDDDDDGAVTLPADTLSLWDRVTRDPAGNAVAIVVLLALLASLVLVPFLALRRQLPALPAWPTPVLALLGMAVSAYLRVVETNDLSAVCGTVADCNTVQQSEYARLLGVPIGVLGVIGYGLLLAGWLVARLVQGRMADLIVVGVAAGAFLGVAFSAYLTFLEPFVIGATCLWCITSALTMLALLWLVARPGWEAWLRLRGRRERLQPRRVG